MAAAYPRGRRRQRDRGATPDCVCKDDTERVHMREHAARCGRGGRTGRAVTHKQLLNI